MKKNPEINLADVAYTLQVGRKTFKYRKMLVVENVKEATELLLLPNNTSKVYTNCSEVNKPIVFMFPVRDPSMSIWD